MPLVILSDPDAVVARLRTPSLDWVEACTGLSGTLFPDVDIDQAGFEAKAGWVAEPAEIFSGYYDEGDEIPESCCCIGVYGGEYHLMEMPTGEIAVYDPNGWDNASGMASAHEFTTQGHAGAAVSLLAAVVRELEPLDDIEDGDGREAVLKPALEEFYAFVEALPDDLDGSHFWTRATEGLADHYETW
ncbi:MULTISPECIES: hypothetical protein [unclassified Streptomyces]|uniref:hypothetical protein n=1 Tax=unclassified Streptomyces TaxID=2593676 RepID=UPI0035DEAE82